MIKGIIFDMDGVLVDSEPIYHEFEYNFFRNLGADITPDYLFRFVGSSMSDTINSICDEFNITVIPRESILSTFSQGVLLIYSQNPKLKLCPGIIDWLEYIKSSGYPAVVASSTYEEKIKVCFERFNLSKYFNAIISGDQVTKSKPDPEIFIKACRSLGFRPEECIVIEDSERGIVAAKSAGCKCIGYLNEGRNTQNISCADIVIDKFGEEKLPMLKKILETL